jgi:hypothetical protein
MSTNALALRERHPAEPAAPATLDRPTLCDAEV